MTWPKVPNLIVSSCPLVLSNSAQRSSTTSLIPERGAQYLDFAGIGDCPAASDTRKAANTAATTLVGSPIDVPPADFWLHHNVSSMSSFIGASYGPKQVKRKLPTKGRGGCSETAARAHGRLGSWPCKRHLMGGRFSCGGLLARAKAAHAFMAAIEWLMPTMFTRGSD